MWCKSHVQSFTRQDALQSLGSLDCRGRPVIKHLMQGFMSRLRCQHPSLRVRMRNHNKAPGYLSAKAPPACSLGLPEQHLEDVRPNVDMPWPQGM